jgi:hypothetical protein
VTVGRGIDDRWWGPAPAELTSDEEPDQAQAEEAVATALLAAADIDTDDLAAIITDPDAKSAASAPTQRRSQPRQNQKKPRRNTKRGSNAS